MSDTPTTAARVMLRIADHIEFWLGYVLGALTAALALVVLR
jgi:hypothetical protein